jgi:hypothetical protein
VNSPLSIAKCSLLNNASPAGNPPDRRIAKGGKQKGDRTNVLLKKKRLSNDGRIRPKRIALEFCFFSSFPLPLILQGSPFHIACLLYFKGATHAAKRHDKTMKMGGAAMRFSHVCATQYISFTCSYFLRRYHGKEPEEEKGRIPDAHSPHPRKL